MDISAEFVPAGPPNGSRDEHKHLDRLYEKLTCLYFHYKHIISLQLFKYALLSDRPMFLGERVLDTFNMVISGMKTNFTPNI